MLNIRPSRRPQIPNSLAIFAVLLLLISVAAGVHTRQDASSPGQESGISVNASTTESNNVNDAARTKSRGINLGLLLFRRG